jgi:hypothetical protein
MRRWLFALFLMRMCNPLQFLLPSREPVPDSSPPKLLFRASVTWLTHPLPVRP